MKSAYDTIIKIRKTASKNEKLAILTAAKGDNDLKEFLRLCYEPRVNFYISKVPPEKAETSEGPWKFDASLMKSIVKNLGERQLTGKRAKDWLAFCSYQLESGWEKEMLTMLIERDVKAGFSESTINKVWKDLVTDVPYMRCSLPKDSDLSKFPWAKGVFSQIKADGMFANITLSEDGDVRIESRNGSPFPLDELSELVADVKKKYVKGYQTHGELLVGIKKMSGIALLTRQEGNGILNKILKGGELDPQYVVLYEAWDMIPAAKATTKGKWALRYAERFANLTQMIGYTDASSLVRLIETRVVTSYADAQAHYAEALSRGLEGTIIKHPEMEWKDGTSKHQVKMKLEFEVDLEVIGYNEGKNKYVGMLGSLECATSDRKLIVNVAGFTDAQRKEIWETKNMKIVTVKSNSVMPPTNKDTYSLFLPIFVEERLDKKTADSLERVLAQFEAATA